MKKIFLILFPIFIIIIACNNEGMIQQGVDSQEDPRIPDINIRQGSTDLASGAGIYSILEEQIFNTMAEVVFTVENKGTSDLELTGDPLVEISGTDASDFSVTVDPEFIIPPGEDTFFTVTFDPAAVDDKTALITVLNNDFDESVYSFTITGSTFAEINIKQGQIDIPSGLGAYTINNVKINETSPEVSFLIENTGNYDLELTGIDPVTLSGDDVNEFEITNEPDTIIPPGGNSTFAITFTPNDTNSKTITVLIETNDLDESEYTFTINAMSKPDPRFTARLRRGIAPLSVEFLDQSIGEITNWEWDFNSDGTIDSTEQNPVAVYDTLGTFSAMLTVTGPGGSNFKINVNYVTVINSIKHTVDSFFDGASTVSADDIDGDGDMDIIGTADDADEIAWWENSGAEGFSKHTIDDAFDRAWSIYVIDLNEDTYPDIVGSAINATVNDNIAWWENDGSGNFTKHSIDTTFWGAYSVLAIDLDQANGIDIIGIAASNVNQIAWWENNGSESFTKHVIADTTDGIDGGHSVFACDIDNDTDIDVLYAVTTDREIGWLENNGSEVFTKHALNDDDNFSWEAVYANDLNGDGAVDIIGATTTYREVAWWENNFGGSFSSKITLDNSFLWPRSIYSTDIDSDGHMDIVGADGAINEIRWWKNDGGCNFTKITVDNNFYGAKSVYPADIDNNGTIDIVGASRFGDEIAWWDLASEGIWYKHVAENNFNYVSSISTADIDGDNDLDIVGAAQGDDTITWFENTDSNGSFSRHDISDFNGSIYVHTTDIDNDNDIDILGVSIVEDEIALWTNSDGKGSFTKTVIDTDYDAAYSAFAADINGDGNNDILAAGYNGVVTWWENDGNQVFTKKPDIKNDVAIDSIISVYAYDFDTDGDIDVLGNTEDGEGIFLWTNNDVSGPGTGNGSSWSENHIYDSGGGNLGSVIPFDIDIDDDMDIVVANNELDKIEWWENDGNGNFIYHEIFSDDCSSVYAADLDFDGDLDVLSISNNNLKFFWYENQKGDITGWEDNWKKHIAEKSAWMEKAIYSADLDGDSDSDIIVYSSEGNEIAWWENNLKEYGP